MGIYPELLSPAYIGGQLIKNRIVMAPMLVAYAAPDGEVSDALLDYYESRALGGAGLIIVEAACVDAPAGRESERQLNIDHSRYRAGLERLSRTIKAGGSRAFIQLLHAGRQTSSSLTGVQPVAPSPLPCPVTKEIPRELSLDEIKDIENKFVDAAGLACNAGFDGVEVHAAHGYLINQFLSPASNLRTDAYGGDLKNRMRLLLNIVARIKTAWPRLALSVRLNIDDFVPGGLTPEESIKICRHLEQCGADLIHCTAGTYESGLRSIEPASYEEGWRGYLAAEVKKHIKIPVVSGGMLETPALAEQLVSSNQADFVFLGRSLLADSQWPAKAQRGRAEDIRPCIRCNNCIDRHLRGLTVDCTVNPETGRERSFAGHASCSSSPASAIVVGSGPAGMQAAIALRQRGIKVALYEQDDRLGGLLNLASIPPHKYRVGRLRDYLIRQLQSSGADIIMNRRYDLNLLQQDPPGHLIIATGSVPARSGITGCDQEHCLDIRDVLENRADITGKNVAIIGGGGTGCEVADYLLAAHNKISVIEQGPVPAAGMERKNRRDLMNRLQQGQVRLLTSCTVDSIDRQQVLLREKGGSPAYVPADYVVIATGFVPRHDLYAQAQKLHTDVYLIGDALEVGGFKNAFLQGVTVARMVAAAIRA